MPKSYSPRLRGKALEEYRKCMQRERQALLVSPERLAWILKTYPPEETGRPGIWVHTRSERCGRNVGKLERHEHDGTVYWKPHGEAETRSELD